MARQNPGFLFLHVRTDDVTKIARGEKRDLL